MKKTLLHRLFPPVRAEILRLLFTNARTELYVRQLARLSDLSLQTVQDELAKLEAAHLIATRSNGYHLFTAPTRSTRSMPRCASLSFARPRTQTPKVEQEVNDEQDGVKPSLV